MNGHTGKVAFFWDKSYLWGLIAYDTFVNLGVDFELLTAERIRGGGLDGHDIVFVPGGWAGDKYRALGGEGQEAIRRFVREGGSYLGFCGGAGLALSHDCGLSLAAIGRKPTSQRLPSFSGRVALKHESPEHPMWSDVPDGMAFHAWWPGQFLIPEGAGVEILASYGVPEAGSFVADLQIGPGVDWERWEDIYGTNLDPGRITGEPAVIEAALGRGRVLLSYLHFETPEDEAGHAVLLNILEYLSGEREGKPVEGNPATEASPENSRILQIASELKDAAGGLVDFGARNFLWYWRNSWILQWRRGVRGMEYSTLYVMFRRLFELVQQPDSHDEIDEATIVKMEELRDAALPFFESARDLLTLERFAMSRGPIGPLKTDDSGISELRAKLFSSSKRSGGQYGEIVEMVDALLEPLLKRDSRRVPSSPPP